MAAQSISDGHGIGHLVGDVPALVLVAGILWLLSRRTAKEDRLRHNSRERAANPRWSAAADLSAPIHWDLG